MVPNQSWVRKRLVTIDVIGHIGSEYRLFSVKSTSAETGMGVTSRP